MAYKDLEDLELENSTLVVRKPFKKKKFELQRLKGKLAKPGVHDFIIVCDNLKASFNVGKIYRSGNAFGVREIHVIGSTYFDPCPAKGALKQIPSKFIADFKGSYDLLKSEAYTIYLLDPAKGENLWDVKFPQKSAFVMGHEQYGHSFDSANFADLKFIKIPQFGCVESLNVSNAASIVMYEYLRQLKKIG